MMVWTETDLPGVLVCEPEVHRDARGFFLEAYREDAFDEHGVNVHFVQDNHSHSVRGTLRGLHYQLHNAQAKLCRVIRGQVLDVAVDIRRGSPTFGKWTAVLLSEASLNMVYIPRGFAHGFAVISEEADFLYRCDNYYDPTDEYGVLWSDPGIGIDWGVERPILSNRDQGMPLLADVPEDALPVYPGSVRGLGA